MVEWESGMPLGQTLCVASRAFKRDVLRIHLSDIDKGLEEHSSGTKERSNTRAVFVIITSAEIYCWENFAMQQDFMNFMVICR